MEGIRKLLNPFILNLLRDRSSEYARGASEGASQAQQIVDRWHVLKNLGEVVLRMVGQTHAALKQRQAASDAKGSSAPTSPIWNDECKKAATMPACCDGKFEIRGLPKDTKSSICGLARIPAKARETLLSTGTSSTGPVEGQINRLKFIKRSMYGRGSFELLRQRALIAA